MRLLIVEDEADLRRTLLKVLRAEGYAVDTAEDGDEGLEKALAWEYDAILLDGMLPKKDGWEVLRQLRQTKLTPVLMLTARDAPADRVRGLDLGADDHVGKPFELEELLARLRALIRRSHRQGTPVWQWGEVILDTAQRRVTRGGEPVALLPSEYQVLEFLALHQGEVVSRTTLYEHLFDENENTLSNLLDVRVSNLRRKLGADLIVTRRGHGYGLGIEP